MVIPLHVVTLGLRLVVTMGTHGKGIEGFHRFHELVLLSYVGRSFLLPDNFDSLFLMEGGLLLSLCLSTLESKLCHFILHLSDSSL